MAKRIKWTLKELKQEALKYKTRGEFQEFSSGAYQAALNSKILDIVCSHMPKHVDQTGKNHPMFKWTNEALKKEALKYKSLREFRKKSPKQHKAASRRKILDEICSHMREPSLSGENSASFKWTYEMLKTEALKYKSKSEFRKRNDGAYQTVKNRKLLDELCAHMPKYNRGRGEKHYAFRWTHEMLQAEALKYDTRGDFQEKSRKAFDIAHRRKIIDEICVHMKQSTNTSKPEIELFNILKESFSNLIKKTFPVQVLGKPHIHRFQVDILNPETKLGIEFDGKYHHSENYLIKSKTKIGWPIEDAINYHEIKDEALFDCHGITLLHIKEVDWNSNKQACIDKCLEFLGVEQKKVA